MGERLRFIGEEKSKKKPVLLQLLLVGGLLAGLSQVRDGEKDSFAGAARTEKETSYRPPSLPPLGFSDNGDGTLFPIAEINSLGQKWSQETEEEKKVDENSPTEKLNRFMPYLENQLHVGTEKMEKLRKNILDLMEDIPFLSAPDASRIIIKEWIEEEKAHEKMKKEKKAKRKPVETDEENESDEGETFVQEETSLEGTLPLPEVRLPNGPTLFVVDIEVSAQGQLLYTLIDPKDVFKTKKLDRTRFIQAMEEILKNAGDIERVFALKEKDNLSLKEQEELNHLIEKLHNELVIVEFINE